MQELRDPTTVIIEIQAVPERADELEQKLVALNEEVAKEPFYGGVQINREGERFLMYERWWSEAYFTGKHQHTDHLTAFMAQLPTLAVDEPTVSFLQLVRGFGQLDEAA